MVDRVELGISLPVSLRSKQCGPALSSKVFQRDLSLDLAIAQTIPSAPNAGARRKAASEGDQMYCLMEMNGERFAQ
jgi:hypothetical protein